MTDLIQPFLKDNYSIQQLRMRMNVLRTYLLGKFFKSENQQEGLTPEDKKWLESLDQEFLNHFTAMNVNQELENIDKAIRQLQPLVIYVPVELPEEEINRMGDWVRKNFANNMVMDIKFDGTLIGGAALSWKGIYHDLSLRSVIEKDKAAITENLKKYLR